MAIWLVRAGKYGEYEDKFLEERRVYLTWTSLSHNLSLLKDRNELRSVLEATYPDAPTRRITNNVGQIWAFSHGIECGDWIVLPSKQKAAIHVAEVIGDYSYISDAQDPFFHFREVNWISQDVPRTNFDQDLLYSFGAFMTVCQVRRNDAERRIREMASNGWKASSVPSILDTAANEESVPTSDGLEDLGQAARDQLGKFIIARFQGHDMARLVDAVLRARGYITHLSGKGPDGGVDILATPDPIGFGEPRLCVQVKSGDTALDRSTLDQLIGVMQNVQASHGLLVSWSGFKTSVQKEVPRQFFRVRLWDQGALIDEVLSQYDNLDEEIRKELPLKRIWVVSQSPA